MKQNTAVLQALQSIEKLMEIDEVQRDILRSHLLCIYAVGYEEGLAERPGKAVEQYKDGILIHKYESITKAAKAINMCRSSIEGAIQRNGTCSGYVWKYKK